MPDGRGKFSLEEIREGLERFYQENGHYPIAPEMDACSYLPTTRSIQRNFGGVIELRKLLGHKDINFGQGEYRSQIAKRINKIGYTKERELEKILIDHFGEPFVHIEKPLDHTGKRRLDFFIYAKNIKFGIDIFYSETRKDIQKIINVKIDNYINYVSFPVYFVLANESIGQNLLDGLLMGKIKLLPQNIKLITWGNFLLLIRKIDSQK